MDPYEPPSPATAGLHKRGSFLELFSVALPLMISAGSHSVMSVADRMMLARYVPGAASGAETLDVIAAVTPAGMLHWTVACLPIGVILYANTFIAQYDGAQKPKQMIASFWQAVWVAIFTGLLLLIPMLFSGAVFRAVGHNDIVVAQETAYFNTLCGGSTVMMTCAALSCFFSGRRKTWVVMWVNVFSVIINITLDYGLIYGHWGLPALGIRGAAMATVCARCCELCLYIYLIRRHRGEYAFRETCRVDRSVLKKYVEFGVPSGLHYFVDNVSFLMFLFIVGSMSREAMAATNLAFSVNSMVFVPLLGFGTAVQTVVGNHIGANVLEAVPRTTWNAARMGLVWTGVASILLIFFPETSLAVFSSGGSNPSAQSIAAVLPLSAQLLKFVAVYSVFDSLAVVFAASLRGAGDTMFPMLMTMCSSWLIMTVPAWVISLQDGATIHMLWMTCTAHIIVMGTAMTVRFMSGRWKRIQVT